MILGKLNLCVPPQLCSCSILELVHVCLVCVLAGLLVGWLRLPDQPHPLARAGADAHRALLPQDLCSLLHSLLLGNHPVHADLFCWLPGGHQGGLHTQGWILTEQHLILLLAFIIEVISGC